MCLQYANFFVLSAIKIFPQWENYLRARSKYITVPYFLKNKKGLALPEVGGI
jgi:hypothetical protein